MIKAVLFDLDGTLLDTKPFIVASFHHVCSLHGLDVITEEMIQSLGGASLHDTYRHYHPDHDLEMLCQAHCEFQDGNPEMIRLFPESLAALSNLTELGLRSGVITSRHSNARVLMEATRILEYFSVVVTCDDIKYPKPHPESMLLALDQLGLGPDEVVFVGDMEADILLGRNTGVRTIGVSCGFSSTEEMRRFNPDHAIETLDEIAALVRSLL